MNKLIALILFLGLALQCHSQQGNLEEYFFQSGKIKVVIWVAVSIAIGLFLYLWRLDKKVSRLEKKENEKN